MISAADAQRAYQTDLAPTLEVLQNANQLAANQHRIDAELALQRERQRQEDEWRVAQTLGKSYDNATLPTGTAYDAVTLKMAGRALENTQKFMRENPHASMNEKLAYGQQQYGQLQLRSEQAKMVGQRIIKDGDGLAASGIDPTKFRQWAASQVFMNPDGTVKEDFDPGTDYMAAFNNDPDARYSLEDAARIRELAEKGLGSNNNYTEMSVPVSVNIGGKKVAIPHNAKVRTYAELIDNNGQAKLQVRSVDIPVQTGMDGAGNPVYGASGFKGLSPEAYSAVAATPGISSMMYRRIKELNETADPSWKALPDEAKQSVAARDVLSSLNVGLGTIETPDYKAYQQSYKEEQDQRRAKQFWAGLAAKYYGINAANGRAANALGQQAQTPLTIGDQMAMITHPSAEGKQIFAATASMTNPKTQALPFGANTVNGYSMRTMLPGMKIPTADRANDVDDFYYEPNSGALVATKTVGNQVKKVKVYGGEEAKRQLLQLQGVNGRNFAQAMTAEGTTNKAGVTKQAGKENVMRKGVQAAGGKAGAAPPQKTGSIVIPPPDFSRIGQKQVDAANAAKKLLGGK